MIREISIIILATSDKKETIMRDEYRLGSVRIPTRLYSELKILASYRDETLSDTITHVLLCGIDHMIEMCDHPSHDSKFAARTAAEIMRGE